MDGEMSNEDINYQKAIVLLNENSIVHVSLKNRQWYNGRLFRVTKDYLVIHDREEGRKTVFFVELKSIDVYKSGEEKNG